MYIWVNIMNKYFLFYSNYKKNQYIIFTKVSIINVSVMVWIRMISTVLYIWMLSIRRLNCLKGLERLGGMAFWKKCVIGVGFWGFNSPGQAQPLFPCLRVLRLLQFHVRCHTPYHNDNILTLCNWKQAAVKLFFVQCTWSLFTAIGSEGGNEHLSIIQ